MPADTLRKYLRVLIGVGAALRTVCIAPLLLAARIWLSQVLFVHEIMMMMGNGHTAPSALDAGLHGVSPLLLVAGLLTRPAALLLLLRTLWDPGAGQVDAIAGANIGLLLWLVTMGGGLFSLDRLLGRGLALVPLWPIRAVHHLYGWSDRIVAPVLKLILRVAIAVTVLGPMLPASRGLQTAILGSTMALSIWWAISLGVLLAIGCATPFATVILAAMIPLAGITMSMDDRLSAMLLLLLLTASGAGALSMDWLIARWARAKPQSDTLGDSALPHVVIVGGGFGGVAAAQGLRNAACRVTLIDKRNHHLFQPLLYQVATAALSPADIATPIRSLFRQQTNIRIILGEVTGIDQTARQVLLGETRIGFDYLVLATGARHGYFGRDDWAAFAPGLKSIEDATLIRGCLLRAFEEAETATADAEREACLTFVIVGGGPTGIELAGAIAELARHGLDQEFRSVDPATARVILVQSGPRVLPSFPPRLSAAAERSLRALGVDVRVNARVRGVDEAGVQVGDQHIAARTILWAAGVMASPAARWLGQPGDPSGRLTVGADLAVPGTAGIYAIGDTVASMGWRGVAVPGLAPAAKQQGLYVARIINAVLRRRSAPKPFRYRHFGSLATIGRQAAVAELGPIRLWGAPAWWFWGAAHVAFLAGGRNRATVLLNWLWAYLTYRRSTRLITGATPATRPRS